MKRTSMAQDAPAGTLAAQSFDCEKGTAVAIVPSTSCASPVFWSVTLRGALSTPTACFAKVSFVGTKVATPVPARCSTTSRKPSTMTTSGSESPSTSPKAMPSAP